MDGEGAWQQESARCALAYMYVRFVEVRKKSEMFPERLLWARLL